MNSVVPPYRVNLLLTISAFAIAAIQLVIVPFLLMPESGLEADLLAGAIAVLLSLTTPFNRALLHEAIHGRLVRRRDWNVWLGRALAICSGISFDAIRLGHMTHHRFPRHALDRVDVIEPGMSRVIATVKFPGEMNIGQGLQPQGQFYLWVSVLLDQYRHLGVDRCLLYVVGQFRKSPC